MNREEYIKKIITIRHIAPKEELALCKKLKELAIQTDDSYALCYATLYTCDALFFLGRLEEALEVGRQSLSLLLEHTFNNLILTQCNLIALLCKHLDDEQGAMEHYFLALKLAKEEQNHFMISAIYSNLTNLYLGNKAYSQAEQTLLYAQAAFNKGNLNVQNINVTEDLLLLNFAQLAYYKGLYQKSMSITYSLLNRNPFDEAPLIHLYGIVLLAKCYSRLGTTTKMEQLIDSLFLHDFSRFVPLTRLDFYKNICELCVEVNYPHPLYTILQEMHPIVAMLNLPNKWVLYYDLCIQSYSLQPDVSMDSTLLEQYYYWSGKQESFLNEVKLNRLQNITSLHNTQKHKEQLQQRQVDLQQLANNDALTGISNRHGLNQYLSTLFDKKAKEVMSLCIMILDVDYFKEYNDTYGHLQGDLCLKQIGETLSNAVKDTGYLARYGGDEFIVIFTNTTLEAMDQLAQQLIFNISTLNITHTTSQVSDIVTVTIGGIHDILTPDSILDDFIDRADASLYQVKNTTRNSYFIQTKQPCSIT